MNNTSSLHCLPRLRRRYRPLGSPPCGCNRSMLRPFNFCYNDILVQFSGLLKGWEGRKEVHKSELRPPKAKVNHTCTLGVIGQVPAAPPHLDLNLRARLPVSIPGLLFPSFPLPQAGRARFVPRQKRFPQNRPRPVPLLRRRLRRSRQAQQRTPRPRPPAEPRSRRLQLRRRSLTCDERLPVLVVPQEEHVVSKPTREARGGAGAPPSRGRPAPMPQERGRLCAPRRSKRRRPCRCSRRSLCRCSSWKRRMRDRCNVGQDAAELLPVRAMLLPAADRPPELAGKQARRVDIGLANDKKKQIP